MLDNGAVRFQLPTVVAPPYVPKGASASESKSSAVTFCMHWRLAQPHLIAP